MVGIGYFNGDSYDFILWRHCSGSVGNWLAGAGGHFTNNAANSLVGVPSAWTIVATGDFNGDGNDDIAWYNSSTHQLGNWLGQDNGGWLINDAGLYDLGAYTVVGAGDFDNDGTDELLIVNWTVPDSHPIDFLSTTPGGFFFNDDGGLGIIASGWEFIGTGDFDGDGQDDVLLRSSTGTVMTWLAHLGFGINGRGFVANWDWAVTVPLDWQIVGIGDFNGDSYADILWRHSSGTVGNWLGGEDGMFTINNDSLIGVPWDWEIAATGDYDGDGRDDILWRNTANGALGTWLGTDSGVFTINPEPLVYVSTDWQVQPRVPNDPIWDI
jgi:hypothetical protein